MHLLGILPISSVRMRPCEAGFQGVFFTRMLNAPMQRPQASLLSERRNAGAGQRLRKKEIHA